MEKQITDYDRKQIKSFENAYVRKQTALVTIKTIHDIIAKKCGYESYYKMVDAAYESDDRYSGFWNDFNWIARNDFPEFEKARRTLSRANSTLDRTKYTYWYFNPQGTPKVMAYGKFDYKLEKQAA